MKLKKSKGMVLDIALLNDVQ